MIDRPEARGARRSHHEHTEAFLRNAIREDPGEPRYHRMLGDVLSVMGRSEDAETAFRSALTLVPGDVSLRMRLVGVLLARRAPADALALVDEALADHAAVAEVWWRRGQALTLLGDFTRALDSFDRALSIDPSLLETHCDRAAALTRLGRNDEALRSYREAVERWPESVRARKDLALALIERGDPSSATAVLHEGVLRRRGRPGNPARTDRVTTTPARLRHDIEQCRYLRGLGLLPESITSVIARYEQVLAELPRSLESRGLSVVLTPEQRELLGDVYDRVLSLADAPASSTPALGSGLDAERLAGEWAKGSVVVIDRLLSETALASLRRFCLESTIWFAHDHEGGYLSSFMADGFCCGLLLQIAEELRTGLPTILGDHPLREMWAVTYDRRTTGVHLHADPAKVNVNFWITPDAANLDPTSGGLHVYRRAAPLEWTLATYNGDPRRSRALVEASSADVVRVPYRQNRAVVFDANFFHETAPYTFREGYENRRINVTMLFGDRG